MDSVPELSRPRGNPLVKAALLLLVILLLVLGGACLVPTLIHKYFVKVTRSQVPEEVRRIGGLITDIEVPDGFEPDDSLELDQFGEKTRAVQWRHKKYGSVIVLFELPQKFDATSPPDVRIEIMRFPFDSTPEAGFYFAGASTHETEDVEVRGEKVTFEIFAQQQFPGAGTSVDPQFEVIGTFPSKSRKQSGMRYCGAGCDRKALSEFVKSIR